MTTLEITAKLGEMICLTALWCLFLKRGMNRDPNLYFVCTCMLGFDLMRRHAFDNPISLLNKILIGTLFFSIIVQGFDRLYALWKRRKICRRNIKRLIAKF